MSEAIWTPEGWEKSQPTAEVIAHAKKRARAHDAIGRNGRNADHFDMASFEETWHDYLAESALDQLTKQHALTSEWNGGVDNKPDFRIEGRSINVKCPWGSNKPQKHYDTPTLKEQDALHQVEPWLFFGIYVPSKNDLYLLGIISRQRFMAKARFVKKGEMLHGKFECWNNCYRLPIHELLPTKTWLDNLKGASQHEQIRVHPDSHQHCRALSNESPAKERPESTRQSFRRRLSSHQPAVRPPQRLPRLHALP